MKRIPLTKGKYAVVDDDWYEMLKHVKWSINIIRGVPKYAHCWAARDNTPTIEKMHRVIMGVSDPRVKVDHKDGDGLNNQQNNLRICTLSQNQMNRRKHKITTSRFKGVYWERKPKRKTGKWRVQISKNNKRYYFGCFNDEIKAARVYNKAAKELHGEFAKLNDI